MLIFYYIFEKLHRYVYDYCFQSTNEDFGAFTPYKKANSSNKYRKYNDKIEQFYFYIKPCFKKFRYKLRLYFPRIYKRYEPTDFKKISQYSLNKNYNWIDKLILKYRIYQISK